jgi:hypothetical protein
MGEFRLEEDKEMKDPRDLREIETEAEEIEVISKRGWCACVGLWFWDCFKSMGRGFEFDNGNHHPGNKNEN